MVLVESRMRQSTTTSFIQSCSERYAFTTAQYFNFKRNHSITEVHQDNKSNQLLTLIPLRVSLKLSPPI